MHLYIKKISVQNAIITLMYFALVTICFFFITNEYRNTYIYYMFVLTCSLIFASLSDLIRNVKQSNICFWLGIVILGSVMAFRAQTGIDDFQYKNYFMRAGEGDLVYYINNSITEKGYAFINYILYKITNGNYNIAQAIITYGSFILWGIAIKGHKDYGSYPVLVLLLWTHYYFLIMGAGLVRIFIAIPIIFIALDKLQEGREKQFVFFVLVASMFHISSLIMLILLVLGIQHDWFYRHWLLFVAILAVIIPIIYLLVAKMLVPILGIRYAAYASVRRLRVSIGSFDVLPIWLFGLYFMRYVEYKNKKRYILGMVLISLSMIFSVYASMVSVGRLIYYANLGLLIIISEICKMEPRNILDNIMPIILIIYSFLYLMRTGFCNTLFEPNIFPYVSFWITI